MSQKYSLKEHVTGFVDFQYYFNNQLWYKTSETKLLFPVPISDAGDGKFLASDKALYFMRYIRAHIQEE